MKKTLCWLLLTAFAVTTLFAQGSGQLNQKIESIIQELKSSRERGFSLLPLETSLADLQQRDQHLKIFLDLPFGFLENELDDLIVDEITEELVSPLSEFHIHHVSILARDRQGHFKELSRFFQDDFVPLMAYVPNEDPVKMREGRVTSKNLQLSNNAKAYGALNGKTVWLSAGHGWQYSSRNRDFCTQRRNSFGVVEDFASIEFVNYHLLKYLQQAGANVWTVRERDMNKNELIINNDDGRPHYVEQGKWYTSRSRGYKGSSYRYAISKKRNTATASFVATIPESGLYWVSVHFVNGLNRSVDTRYQIHHAGGISEVSINQEIHGNTWVYLGQFYFEKSGVAKVVLRNESYESGQAVIADAVRFGGGIGDTPDCQSGRKSREPRFEMASKYYASFQGYPGCSNDVVTRPRYAEWELAKGNSSEKKNAVYVSIHTNGSGGSGTESYIHNYRPVKGSKSLQHHIHREMIKDIRSQWDSRWPNRGEKAADFGELRNLRTMPGVLIELGFHDHPGDARALTTPAFRQLSARSIYKGIVRYFAQKAGVRPVFLPETPTHLTAENKSLGRVSLQWRAPKYGGALGSPATKYKVFISQHGRAFADHRITTQTQFSFSNLLPGTTYYFRVVAVNEGGESFPSPVVAVRTPDPDQESAHYLLVDGVDRLDRSQAIVVYEAAPRFAPLGKVRRLFLEQMNDFSYSTEHASALESAGISFDGTVNEAVSLRSIDLKNYDGVDWILGRESTENETLNATERALLKSYLDRGGRLLISGSEIGYHLSEKGADRSFYQQYLKAHYRGDNANASRFIGRNHSIFRGLNGHFKNNSYFAYPINSPDYLLPTRGGEALFKYSNGKTAAIGYNGQFGLVHFAFPLEMIADQELRNEIFFRSLEYLHPPHIRNREKQQRPEIANIRN